MMEIVLSNYIYLETKESQLSDGALPVDYVAIYDL
jgi:hypothetical protein